MTHQGHTTAALARDISPFGIGIYTEERLALNDILDMTISFTKGIANLVVKGVVCYCIANPDNANQSHPYLAGIEFNEEAKEEAKGDVKNYKVSHSLSIQARPDDCYRMICDFERYPPVGGRFG